MISISWSYSMLSDPPQRSILVKWRQRGSKSIYAKEDLKKRWLYAWIAIAMKSKCGCAKPLWNERKVVNHADEKHCVNLTSLGKNLRGLITSQGYIGSNPFKQVSYQTCGEKIHLCHVRIWAHLHIFICMWRWRFFFVPSAGRYGIGLITLAALLCCCVNASRCVVLVWVRAQKWYLGTTNSMQ